MTRCPLPVLLLLAAGCASAAHAEPVTPDAPTRVELAVRTTGRAVFSSEQTIFMENGGDGRSLRLRAVGRIDVRPLGGGDERRLFLRRYEAPLEMQQDGEEVPLRGDLVGLEDLGLRGLIDRRSELLEGPEMMDRPAASRLLQSAVLGLARLVHLSFPDEAIEVGARWRPTPYRVDPMPGRFDGVEVTPELSLVGVERDAVDRPMARIEWHTDLRVLPFEAMGTQVEGLGQVRGFSLVSLDDGVSGRTELDLSVAFGPAGSADLLPLLTVSLKYAERVTRREGRQPRPLLSPVPPRGARGADPVRP